MLGPKLRQAFLTRTNVRVLVLMVVGSLWSAVSVGQDPITVAPLPAKVQTPAARPDSFIRSPLELPPSTAVESTPISPRETGTFPEPVSSGPSTSVPFTNSYPTSDPIVSSGPAFEVITDNPIATDSNRGANNRVIVVESPRRQRLSRLEKLLDGGDRFPKARVRDDWTVIGLDTEDTIAHFDTLDGRTRVSESNQVAIYAPRFAAVRQVKNIWSSESVNPAGRVRMMSAPNESESHYFADIVKFDDAPIESIRDLPAHALEDRAPGRTVEQVDVPTLTLGHRPAFVGTQITNVDELFLDRLAFDETYSQELIIDNVISTPVVVQDNTPASIVSETSGANEVFEYKLPDGKARVRVLKLASTKAAHAGDIVRFTIRFDNVGDEAVGNVTIMDNLTTRFVYIPDSATCDLDAEFKTEPNDQQSKILRWEIAKPIEPGHGGIIRFDCRVR